MILASARARFQPIRTRSRDNDPRTTSAANRFLDRRGIRASRSISRVLSRTTIHLGRPSPIASSGLPGSGADHALGPLFGLAPGGVYLAGAVARPRGALLPHPFTLANRVRRHLGRHDTAAVCFLLHLPWARAPQGLPGALSYGARTFLTPRTTRGCLTDSSGSVAGWPAWGDSRNRWLSPAEAASADATG